MRLPRRSALSMTARLRASTDLRLHRPRGKPIPRTLGAQGVRWPKVKTRAPQIQ
jgi:hypothetical protein